MRRFRGPIQFGEPRFTESSTNPAAVRQNKDVVYESKDSLWSFRQEVTASGAATFHQTSGRFVDSPMASERASEDFDQYCASKSVPRGRPSQFLSCHTTRLRNGSSYAPNRERVNEVVLNIPEFYEAFDVTSGDRMYRPQNMRAGVW